MTQNLGYLGPEGSYAEQAAILYDKDADKVPYPSIPGVVKAVEKFEVTKGLVPIENSIEGSVTYTLDLLIHDSKLLINDEIVLPIHQIRKVNTEEICGRSPGSNNQSRVTRPARLRHEV